MSHVPDEQLRAIRETIIEMRIRLEAMDNAMVLLQDHFRRLARG